MSDDYSYRVMEGYVQRVERDVVAQREVVRQKQDDLSYAIGVLEDEEAKLASLRDALRRLGESA